MMLMVLSIFILSVFPEIVTWLPDKLMGKSMDFKKAKYIMTIAQNNEKPIQSSL